MQIGFAGCPAATELVDMETPTASILHRSEERDPVGPMKGIKPGKVRDLACRLGCGIAEEHGLRVFL